MTEPPVVRPRPMGVATRRGDALVGAAAIARDTAVLGAEVTAALLGNAWGLLWRRTAPVRDLVPWRYRAIAADVVAAVEADIRSRIADLAARGDVERRRQAAQLSELLDRLVPVVVAEVVQRIDITALVAENVDLDTLAARIDVDAIAERIDLEAIVDRLDLAAITDDVLDEIDLPEIIRESTGSLGSAAVVDVRMRGIDADDAVSGFVDRLLRRRRSSRDDPGGDDT